MRWTLAFIVLIVCQGVLSFGSLNLNDITKTLEAKNVTDPIGNAINRSIQAINNTVSNAVVNGTVTHINNSVGDVANGTVHSLNVLSNATQTAHNLGNNTLQMLINTTNPSSNYQGPGPNATWNGTGNQAAGNKNHFEQLPNGLNFSALNPNFEAFNATDVFSRVVANNKEVYVLHSVQTNGKTMVFDPYTIGQVIGYIYELAEFGPQGPPGGFTIALMNGGNLPSSQKRSVPGKSRAATLIFRLKSKRSEDVWNDVPYDDLEQLQSIF
ncbi:unnamed protein product [Caenorhabditis sp. 36 PRJEB53466]|nr:unnamed protein product [Caenorhabditis sp. 36 PRJEB53466]